MATEDSVPPMPGYSDILGPYGPADSLGSAVRKPNCVCHTPRAVVEPQVVVRIFRVYADREDLIFHDAQCFHCAPGVVVSKRRTPWLRTTAFFSACFPKLSLRAHPNCYSQFEGTFFQERLPGLSATRDALVG